MPRLRAFFLVLIPLLVAAACFAVELPTGGTALFTGTPPTAFTSYGGTVTTVATAGTPFAQGWRLQTTVKATNTWDFAISAPIPRAVQEGDRALVTFYARTVSAPSDPDGQARMTLYVQKNSSPYDRSLTHDLWLSTTWKEFAVPFEFVAGYGAGGAAIGVELGFDPQTIELAGMQVYYYGTARALSELPRTRVDYIGMEPGAAWRVAALQRIESLRKGNFSVKLTDTNGTPIAGAKIRVQLKKHAFPFGTALQFSRLRSDSPQDIVYQRKFLELFNAAGPENDLKWQPLAGDWGADFTLDRAREGLQWLVNRGIETRGHVMVWPGARNLPKAVNDLIGTSRQNEIPGMALTHIDEVSAGTQGLVTEWDVQNEPADNHLLMDTFGQHIMVDWFQRAREKNPGVRLYLNDYNNHDIYARPNHIDVDDQVLTYLIANGAPINGFGIQGHLNYPTAPSRLLATFDHFAAYGLPIHITEFDFDTTDEQLQADYTKDFMIACFSHPAINGIQHWGFWEEAHWLPRAAMYRSDWSEKPNGAVFRSLVHGDWQTDLELTTDANGIIQGRGFLGDYVATAEVAGRKVEKQFQIHSNSQAANVVMTDVAPTLINLSTRGPVGAKLPPMIAGIAIRGTSPKRMLIRGVGPTLSRFDVASPASAVTLRISDIADHEIVSNAGWSAGGNATEVANAALAVGAFDLNANSLDAAVVVTLSPGIYYAQLTSPSTTEGIALIEAYELDGQGSELVNLSTRGHVSAGGGAGLFPGLYVRGNNSRTFLIRAVGAGLDKYSVPDTLDRPVLRIFRGQTVIAENSAWEASGNINELKAAADTVGAFALEEGNRDSAILITLEPGGYTAQVTGANGTTGNVLLEVYRLP